MKSFWCRPPILWVHQVTVTLPHSVNSAGWCPSSSACSPALLVKASAWAKLRNPNTRSRRLTPSRCTTCHSGTCGLSSAISASVSVGSSPRQAVHFISDNSLMFSTSLLACRSSNRTPQSDDGSQLRLVRPYPGPARELPHEGDHFARRRFEQRLAFLRRPCLRVAEGSRLAELVEGARNVHPARAGEVRAVERRLERDVRPVCCPRPHQLRTKVQDHARLLLAGVRDVLLFYLLECRYPLRRNRHPAREGQPQIRLLAVFELHVVDRLPARRYVASVRVEQEDAPETRVDEALQSVREHPNVGLIAEAYGSGEGAVVIRHPHPERRQKQRLITQLHLGPPG